MSEQQARDLARLIGGTAVQSGGGIWIVVKRWGGHVIKLTPYGWVLEDSNGWPLEWSE